MENIYLEIFGYIGSLIILSSMLMTSMVKLRIVNVTGSVINTVYAIFIGAWPIVFLNISMITINIVQIIREKFPKQKAMQPSADGEIEKAAEH